MMLHDTTRAIATVTDESPAPRRAFGVNGGLNFLSDEKTPPDLADLDEYVTPAEIAALLRVSERALEDWRRQGRELHDHHRFGGRVRYHRDLHVVPYVRSRRVEIATQNVVPITVGDMPEFMTEDEVAALFKLTPATLRQWRHLRVELSYYKFGSLVRYGRTDVISYAGSAIRAHTA